MNDSIPPKRKLRWYQFSLRTLLVVTLIAAIGFGFLGHRIQRVRNEIRATDELMQLGSKFYFYPQGHLKDVMPIPDRWLWKCFSDQPVQRVFLAGTQATDTDLEHLKGLTSLKGLYLDDTQVTDAGLAHLKGITSLQTLWLNRTQVTDAGVKKLQEALPQCKIHR